LAERGNNEAKEYRRGVTKFGRPRRHESDADRQRAYRMRKREMQDA
jgi:hypothetical protein